MASQQQQQQQQQQVDELAFGPRPLSTLLPLRQLNILYHRLWASDDDDDDMNANASTSTSTEVEGAISRQGLELDLRGILEGSDDELDDEGELAATSDDSSTPPPKTLIPASPPGLTRKPSLSSAPTSPEMGGGRWDSMSHAAAAASGPLALGLAFSPPSNSTSSTPLASASSSIVEEPSSKPSSISDVGERRPERVDEGEEGRSPSLRTARTSSTCTTIDSSEDNLPPTPSSPTSSVASSQGEQLSFVFPLPSISFGPSTDGQDLLPCTPPPPHKSPLPSTPPTASRIYTVPASKTKRNSLAAVSPLRSVSLSAPSSPRPPPVFSPSMRRTASSNNHHQQYQAGPPPPPTGLPPAAPPQVAPLSMPSRHQRKTESNSSASSAPLSPFDGSQLTSPTTSVAASSSASRGFRSPKAFKTGGNTGGGGWSQLLNAFPRSSSKQSLGPGSVRSTSNRSDYSDRSLLPSTLEHGGSVSHRHSNMSTSTSSSQPLAQSYSSDAHLATHPYAASQTHLSSGRLSDPPPSSSTVSSNRRPSNGTSRRDQASQPLALVVSEGDKDDDGYKCPVCVEPVGANYRIAGEKPDVMPECGHAIHHDCFVHVYGPLPEKNRFGDTRKPQSFGVCGVCRKSMKVGDSANTGNASSGKGSKLASLTGVQSMNAPPPPLLVPSQLGGSGASTYLDDSDVDENDPINPLSSGSSSTRSGQSDHVRYEASNTRIVVPSITVLPEYRNVVRGRPGTKTTVTAVVVFEVPERSRAEEPSSSSSQKGLRGTRSEMSLRPSPSGSPTLAQGPFGSSNVSRGISHTPVDILLIFSLASPSTTTSSAAFKTRVIRSSLAFIMSKMGSLDRMSIVTYESGPDGVIRKTPFLAVGRDGEGRRRLLDVVENMGNDSENDRHIVPLHREERSDVVSAVNVALDVLLQRKTRNPISGVALVCDSADAVNRSQMDLVIARAEAAAVPIHSIGFGKAHDPSPLWLISNHTAGDYTFVPEWNDLQESLAGVIGGIMSIALTQVKLHFSTQDQNFKFSKVCGPLNAVLPPDGNSIDIELRELCHGEKREIIIEMELQTPGSSHESQSSDDSGDSRDWADKNDREGAGGVEMIKSLSSRSGNGRGYNRDSMANSDANHLGDSMFAANATIEEVPCLELDCSFFDPLCSKSCTRLARPILLQLTLLPFTNGPINTAPETVVVRRRMELLASDMISRALIFISKTRSFDASLNLLEETRVVLKGKIDDLIEQIGRDSMHGFKSAKKAAKDAVNRENLSALEAILLDVGTLVEAFEEDSWVDFNREQKNFGAQQAMILRSQRSWTPRSEIERLYFTFENAIDLVHQSSIAPRE